MMKANTSFNWSVLTTMMTVIIAVTIIQFIGVPFNTSTIIIIIGGSVLSGLVIYHLTKNDKRFNT